MFSVEPASPDRHGHVVLELSGELSIADAATLGAVLSAAVARRPVIAVDLTPRHPWDGQSDGFPAASSTPVRASTPDNSGIPAGPPGTECCSLGEPVSQEVAGDERVLAGGDVGQVEH